MSAPSWSDWSPAGAVAPWTVGVEEEVMLLEPATWAPASRSDEVLAALPEPLARHARAETHGSALELATEPRRTVAAVASELVGLREGLAATLPQIGAAAAVAGTHPLARWQQTEVSPGARYQFLYSSLRELARREPTFGLHVHVAVPSAEAAIRALNGMRAHLPLLLALSANSPYWQGRDSGLDSARTPLFQAFPRSGLPRHFEDWEDYVEAIDVLVRCDAIPEPTFIWWDARLQPRFGTLEVRIMDAQTRVGDTAALAALVQCLVRMEALEGSGADAGIPEVLAENRFLAARDGVRAALVDPAVGRRVPVRERVTALLAACAPHAADLGCASELAAVAALAAEPGAARQRAVAAERGLSGLMAALHLEFASPKATAATAGYPPASA